MRDSSLSAANQLSEQIRSVKSELSELQSVQRTVLDSIDENKNVMREVAQHMYNGRHGFVPPQYQAHEGTENMPPNNNESLNAAQRTSDTTNDIHAAYQKTVNDLRMEMNQLRHSLQQQQGSNQQPPPYQPSSYQPHSPYTPFQSSGRGGGRFNRRGGRGGRGGGRGTFQRQNVSEYCWTHGACGHPSSACRFPAPGHMGNATFENKLGGSTYYCPNTKKEKNDIVSIFVVVINLVS